MQEDKKLRKIFIIISVALFIASLTQKCYCTSSECSDSIMVFLLGWAAIMSGGGIIPWLANPLLIISWGILNKNLKASMVLSVFATLFSLSFFVFDSVADNEGGVFHKVSSYEPGYWLWLASNITMLIATFTLMLRYNIRKAAAVPSRWSKR